MEYPSSVLDEIACSKTDMASCDSAIAHSSTPHPSELEHGSRIRRSHLNASECCRLQCLISYTQGTQ